MVSWEPYAHLTGLCITNKMCIITFAAKIECKHVEQSPALWRKEITCSYWLSISWLRSPFSDLSHDFTLLCCHIHWVQSTVEKLSRQKITLLGIFIFLYRTSFHPHGGRHIGQMHLVDRNSCFGALKWCNSSLRIYNRSVSWDKQYRTNPTRKLLNTSSDTVMYIFRIWQILDYDFREITYVVPHLRTEIVALLRLSTSGFSPNNSLRVVFLDLGAVGW